jgi:hypothetical protein
VRRPRAPEDRLQPQIFAGDLLRAFRMLAPTDAETVQRIGVVLGLTDPMAGTVGTAPQAAAPPPLPPPPPPPAAAQGTDPTGSTSARVASDLTLVSTLRQTGDPPTTRDPDWLAGVDPMAAPGSATPRMPLDPIFVPRWTRAIVSTALSVRTPEGPLDVDRLVVALSRALPIARLPRMPWPTVRNGAQLLVDTSDGMIPYAGDVAQLRDVIVRTVGRDRCEVLAFDACPTRGAGRGIRPRWSAYRPPARAVPLALITDLGIGRPGPGVDRATVREWREFAELARRAGCPTVAFVPYPAARVPAALRASMTVISWDGRTSVRSVHRQVGRGLELRA